MKYLQRAANKRLGLLSGSAILALACGAFVSAAEATWDPVGSVGSSTEVNDEGTTVLAYKLNTDGSSRTANGVTFTDSTTQNGVSLDLTKVGAGTHYVGQSHFVTGSPLDYFSGPDASEYVEICRGLQDAQGDITLALSGLTVGQEYLAQIWAVDMRNGGGSGLTQTVSLDGGAASGTMTRLASPGGVSSYVIGRFTADATSASFVITSSTNDRAVNAFQLRAILPGDPPTADFSATPTQGIAPLEVTFTDNSTAGSGAIVTRHWDFGDGNSTTTANTSITHTFAAPGTYTATLTITADDELSDSTSQTITVVSAEPTAVFSAEPTSGFAPLEVTFTDSSDPGGSAIVNRHWDLGDGNSTTTGATTLTYTYAAAGTYIVTLTVTNDDGFSDSTTETINVAEAGSITWEPVVSSGDGTKFDSTGVNNEGSTVLAMMVNSGGPTTVNGVTFLNFDNMTQNGVTVGYTGGPGSTFQDVNYFTTGSPNDYFSGPTDVERDAYIHAMAGARDGIESITFSGLTVGQDYLVQVWAVDMRNASPVNGYYTLALDGGAPSGQLEYFGPGGGVSSYVIGRFTANATTGALALGNAFRPQFNAVQLRAVTTTPPSNYEEWQAQFPGHDLVDPAADLDGDGMTNFQEFAFGLDPTSGGSVNPVTDVGDLATLGQFSYTRFANSGLTYTVWVSTDLVDWGTEPVTVTEEPGATDAVTGVQTVLVELTNPPIADRVFIRVKAE